MITTAAFAQRGATVLEKRGDDEFFLSNYNQSAKTYEKALQSDTANVLLKLKIAESYRLANRDSVARDWYDKAFSSARSGIDPGYKLNYAKVLISLGFVEEAKKFLLAYQSEVGPNHVATAMLSGFSNAQNFSKNISRFAVKRLDFNSNGMDFSPVQYKDGIVFVSSRSKKGSENEDILKLFYTEESEDGTFSIPEPFDAGSVSTYHEGPVAFYDNGNRRILTRNSFIKKSKLADGSVNPLTLARSERLENGKWSDPVNLVYAGAEYSVAHPAISSDGRTIYFSSNMPGTVGESDLFVSRYDNGKWSTPRNLGENINTPGQELFPSLYKDSLLFFASNGRSGIGGLDLFVCDLKDPELAVTNLGAPINSRNDDFGLFLESGASSGFFSSNRAGGAGADDIYYFEEIQPYAEIQLYDSLTRNPVCAADLTLFSSGAVSGRTTSNLTGEAEFRLRPFLRYELSISAEGYSPSAVTLDPALWPVNQHAQIKVYLKPLHQLAESRSAAGLQRRARSNVTNVISFTSSPLDVDMAVDASTHPVVASDSMKTDSVAVPQLKLIVVEIVNDFPFIILVKNDTIYQMKRMSDLVAGNNDLNIEIALPRGAKRNDYEAIIREQVMAQGFAISRFLLIRSFFFDSGKTWVRNDACAQLDKIVEVMYAHSQLHLEMTFHSDSRGTEAFNLDLSKARSEEVKLYLIKAGVNPDRIISRFVGEGQLLNDCGDLADCDEMLHQINRTAEFKFLIR